MNHAKGITAALGLRSKSGRAILVAIGGPLDSPRLLLRTSISLTSEAVPATFQPYHQVMDLPWEEALVAVRATEALIEAGATATVRDLIRDLGAQGHLVAAAGVVGSPDRDLLRIGSRHVRTHAAEGILFRHVWEVAAGRNGISSHGYSDRDAEAFACERLAWPPARMKQALRTLGDAAGPPWRVDERLAAMGALLALRSLEGPG